MSSLRLNHLNADNLKHLKEWHEDPETQRRISIEDLDQFYKYVQGKLDYWVWLVSEGDEFIGELAVEIIEYKKASISYQIKPSKRYQGYGKKLLRHLIGLIDAMHIETVEALVDDDNPSSMRCLESAGFIRVNDEPDEYDSYLYRYESRQTKEKSDGATE